MNDPYQQSTSPRPVSPSPDSVSVGRTVAASQPGMGGDSAAIQGPTVTTPQTPPIPIEQRRHEVTRAAIDAFRKNPDWVTFFREVLGVGGMVRRMFPDTAERLEFEQTAEYSEIQQMVAQLRERSKHQSESNEPIRVITVRLPKSLHESLRSEAHQKHTSMNQLCISKLLQIIGTDLVPSD